VTKTLSIYGEHDETTDPSVYEQNIKNGFQWLVDNGYRPLAVSLLDEMSLAVRLGAHLTGRKTSSRAKKDGDWEQLTLEIAGCKTTEELGTWRFRNAERFLTLPLTWREPLEEAIERHKEALKGS